MYICYRCGKNFEDKSDDPSMMCEECRNKMKKDLSNKKLTQETDGLILKKEVKKEPKDIDRELE